LLVTKTCLRVKAKIKAESFRMNLSSFAVQMVLETAIIQVKNGAFES